jgi:hypothetical protein
MELDRSVHGLADYYRLIYHCRHFHCRSDKNDSVILAPSVGTIARPQPAVQISTIDGLTIDATVVLGLHFLRCMKSQADWDTHFARRP